MNKKIKHNADEAEINFNTLYPENPELSQVFMLRGIGFAILAILELLQEIKDENNK